MDNKLLKVHGRIVEVKTRCDEIDRYIAVVRQADADLRIEIVVPNLLELTVPIKKSRTRCDHIAVVAIRSQPETNVMTGARGSRFADKHRDAERGAAFHVYVLAALIRRFRKDDGHARFELQQCRRLEIGFALGTGGDLNRKMGFKI